MTEIKKLEHRLSDGEKERAANSYLMSVVVILVGFPLPIINLLSTFVFFIFHRGASSYFVRWHCTQALISQLTVFLINTIGFWWSISVFFGSGVFTNFYVSYIIATFIFNILEFVGTFYTAVKVRRGVHLSWWFYGDITDLIVKNK